MKALYEKTGGFLKGICHPGQHIPLVKEAGLGWVRMDVPFPYDEKGQTQGYRDFQSHCRWLNGQGIGVVANSPFPDSFAAAGIDMTTAAGLGQVEAICEGIARDFADLKICWQAANELFMVHFREPLTEAQAVEFLAASIRGLKKGAPHAAVGHNSVDREMKFPLERVAELCGDYDYIGLDLYDGTWTEGGPDTYEPAIDALYDRTKKPVILMEFGFNSLGAGSADIYADAAKWLMRLGFSGIEDAMNRMEELIPLLPPDCVAKINACAPEDRAQCVITCVPHAMKVWPASAPIPHTEEGQAEFYRRLLPKLLQNPHLGGAVIYCMQDSPWCFFCGQEDCPLETQWGLLRYDGGKKPAFEVVKEIFGTGFVALR